MRAPVAKGRQSFFVLLESRQHYIVDVWQKKKTLLASRQFFLITLNQHTLQLATENHKVSELPNIFYKEMIIWGYFDMM